MKWSPEELFYGDIARVKIGSVYHYGIFCSEQEVIAFGYPPLQIRDINPEEVRVVSTDIDTFSAGRFVERAILDPSEKKRARTPEEIVSLARSRVGEGGYSLLHNNCEHFVNECVFGVRRSSQEDEARARWNKRPLFAVFVMKFPEEIRVEKLYPKERSREIMLTGNAEVKKQRNAVWKLLEQAVSRCFGYQFSELHFHKSREGKWSADEFQFSLTHTETAVAAVVSNGPCGIDIEDRDRRNAYYGRHPEKLPKLLGRILTPAEAGEFSGKETSLDTFLRVWTQKESVFKAYDGKKYIPDRLELRDYRTKTLKISSLPELVLSIAGDQMDQLLVFVSEDGALRKIGAEEMEELQ